MAKNVNGYVLKEYLNGEAKKNILLKEQDVKRIDVFCSVECLSQLSDAFEEDGIKLIKHLIEKNKFNKTIQFRVIPPTNDRYLFLAITVLENYFNGEDVAYFINKNNE